MHAVLKIGDSMVMVGEWNALDARDKKSYPRVTMYFYVEDVDAVHKQAVEAGRSRTNITATATEASRTRLASCGASQTTTRTSRSRNSNAVLTSSWRNEANRSSNSANVSR